jgi:nitrite reductase (NADH) small subunit
MSIMVPPDKVIYNLGPLSRIPLGEGRTFQVEEAAIAIFHTRSGKVICPLHSYKFDLATGRAIGNTCEALKTYTIKVNEHGDLLLTLENVS